MKLPKWRKLTPAEAKRRGLLKVRGEDRWVDPERIAAAQRRFGMTAERRRKP